MFPKPDKPTEGVKPEVPATPVTPAVCNTLNGTMPSCAPLSVPYVPFQQKGSPKYEVAEALDNGTLFPGLNLPFFRKAEAAQVPATPPLRAASSGVCPHRAGALSGHSPRRRRGHGAVPPVRRSGEVRP